MADILVAEDNKELRFLYLDILVHHNVILANDGELAIEELETNTFDLVISDLDMPKKNGIDLLKYITANYQGLPVIILTGMDHDTPYGDMSEGKPLKQYLLEIGAEKVLKKPKDIIYLAHIVNRYIN